MSRRYLCVALQRFWVLGPATTRLPSRSGLIEISLPDGSRVRVGSDVNLAALRRVVVEARPFGFALTDPGRRLSRTRLFPEVTRIVPLVVPMGE
ncbi:MAG: hypothetical protein QOC89_2269 [Paraburkholderia sp.]|jgi:hypothetical protein|nr:hypothetical protein [Paraburkholderia sp.]